MLSNKSTGTRKCIVLLPASFCPISSITSNLPLFLQYICIIACNAVHFSVVIDNAEDNCIIEWRADSLMCDKLVCSTHYTIKRLARIVFLLIQHIGTKCFSIMNLFCKTFCMFLLLPSVWKNYFLRDSSHLKSLDSKILYIK